MSRKGHFTTWFYLYSNSICWREGKADASHRPPTTITRLHSATGNICSPCISSKIAQSYCDRIEFLNKLSHSLAPSSAISINHQSPHSFSIFSPISCLKAKSETTSARDSWSFGTTASTLMSVKTSPRNI